MFLSSFSLKKEVSIDHLTAETEVANNDTLLDIGIAEHRPLKDTVRKATKAHKHGRFDFNYVYFAFGFSDKDQNPTGHQPIYKSTGFSFDRDLCQQVKRHLVALPKCHSVSSSFRLLFVCLYALLSSVCLSFCLLAGWLAGWLDSIRLFLTKQLLIKT